MRKKNLIILGLSIAVIFTACKKDDEGSSDPFKADYNDLSVAQNKANMEDAGIAFISEMEQMKDADAIKVTQNLSELMVNPARNPLTDRIFLPIRLLQDISDGNAGPVEVMHALKSTVAVEETVSVDLESLWESIAARYTWNPATEEFDSTGSADAIIIEFPGLPGDLTNTAVYTVNNFQFVEITSPHPGFGDNIELLQLPTSLHVDLKYEGTTLTAFDFSASYQSDGIPTSFNVTWTVGEFSFSAELTHSPYTQASVKYSFKHNSTILLEWFLSGEGNWSEDALSDPEADVQDIIQSANAYFQIMDIKVAGMVDIQPLANTLMALEEQNDQQAITDQELAEQTATAINDNARLVVVYASSNEKIAEAQAYAYYDDYWNDWYVDMQFVFADESPVDAQTYFSTGFADLVDEINTLIYDLNTDFDLGIEPIQY